jgi:Tfp pilus assembly protein PilO
MKLSKARRDRLILVVLVTLAVSWGLWQFVITTRSGRLSAQRVELDKQRSQLSEAVDWIERAQSVERELTEALAGLAKVEEGLAGRADPYAWSYLLLDRIRRNNPALRRLDVAGKPAVGPVRLLAGFPYEATTFTVVGLGHYHDFGRFVADFENEHPYFRVENIELTPQSSIADAAATLDEREMLNLKFDVVALLKPPSQ